MSGYWISLNHHRHDKNLTDKEKLLLIEISSLSAEKGYCWASNEYLWERLWVDGRTISRNISSLKAKNKINVLLDNSKKLDTKRKISIRNVEVFEEEASTTQMSFDPRHECPPNNNIYKSLIKEIENNIKNEVKVAPEEINKLNELISSLGGQIKNVVEYDLPDMEVVWPVWAVLLRELIRAKEGEVRSLSLHPRAWTTKLIVNQEYIENITWIIMRMGIDFKVIPEMWAIPEDVVIRISNELNNMLSWYASKRRVIRDLWEVTRRWFTGYFERITRGRT